MFDILSIRMTAENFIELEKDYKKLMIAKANKEEWRQAMQSRQSIGKEPYLKRIYERLNNRYNYIEYKTAINNTTLKEHIEKNNNLQLFYQTATYIGLIIETALNDELIAAGAETETSFYLDNNCKTDIKVNGVNYQIKNITYLNFKDQLEKYIEKKVYFIFYRQEKDNIYFITEGGRGVHSAAYVQNMSAYGNYQNMGAAEFIRKLAGKEG